MLSKNPIVKNLLRRSVTARVSAGKKGKKAENGTAPARLSPDAEPGGCREPFKPTSRVPSSLEETGSEELCVLSWSPSGTTDAKFRIGKPRRSLRDELPDVGVESHGRSEPFEDIVRVMPPEVPLPLGLRMRAHDRIEAGDGHGPAEEEERAAHDRDPGIGNARALPQGARRSWVVMWLHMVGLTRSARPRQPRLPRRTSFPTSVSSFVSTARHGRAGASSAPPRPVEKRKRGAADFGLASHGSRARDRKHGRVPDPGRAAPLHGREQRNDPRRLLLAWTERWALLRPQAVKSLHLPRREALRERPDAPRHADELVMRLQNFPGSRLPVPVARRSWMRLDTSVELSECDGSLGAGQYMTDDFGPGPVVRRRGPALRGRLRRL